jgi:hypothetical protein
MDNRLRMPPATETLAYQAAADKFDCHKQGKGESLPEVLVLSTSLLTDRMFLYTRFLNELSKSSSVRVWAMSASSPQFQHLWHDTPAQVAEFPEVVPLKEFPHNYLRRLNEFVWDYRHQPPSRLSMDRHVRNKNQKMFIRALKLPARALALFKAERALEDKLEKLLLNYPRSRVVLERLQMNRPAVVFSTGPFQLVQPGVVSITKSLGIPTLAMIPSWDNISTKTRMIFKYDGYLVWSEQTKQELHYYYPDTRDVPIYVIGAPQFDVFHDERFHQSREEFCAALGLNASLPIIVYAVGSPNFLREHYGAFAFAKKVASGELGEVQLIIRPHPLKDRGEMKELFQRFPQVVLQDVTGSEQALKSRSQDKEQITEWVNTFRHADVVINLSSTVTVDAAICDRPVINLDFDPEPGQPNQALVKDINHLWTHFKPIAESGGVWLVNDLDELTNAVKTYLRQPELHREQRRWIAEYVCGHLDGRCGERMAAAVMDFIKGREDKSLPGPHSFC